MAGRDPWISQWLIGARCAAVQELQSNLTNWAGREDAQMSREPDEALEVLRGIWSAQGQTSADLGEMGTGKSCQRMVDVGFGELDGDDDLRAAWRDRLEREGKLSPDGGTVADLVLRAARPS
jgi:alpha-D-ribose 1-methylphosphonate 5-triphosphate synthase subunit PhnG